jgi:hypothetical protein
MVDARFHHGLIAVVATIAQAYICCSAYERVCALSRFSPIDFSPSDVQYGIYSLRHAHAAHSLTLTQVSE